MRTIRWYFDFLSPFSYLQSRLMGQLPDDVRVTYRPVLLAALLDHWGTVGPAEVAPKRVHTYRFCRWWAERHEIPFVLPPAHPFNPLGALRLAVARDCDPDTIHSIFGFVWGEGHDPSDLESWQELTRRLGLEDATGLTQDPAVKARLREMTEDAVKRGVFGVPTFEIDGRVFWGLDATGMVLDYLTDASLFDSPEMARCERLPIGARRLGPGP